MFTHLTHAQNELPIRLLLVVSNQQHVILSLRVALTLLGSPSRAPQSSDAGVCAHIGTKKKPHLLANTSSLSSCSHFR